MPKRKKKHEIYNIKETDKILGIDYSLSKFGYALIDANGELLSTGRSDNRIYKSDYNSGILNYNKYTVDAYKMYKIAFQIKNIIFACKPTFCVFEGGSFGSFGAAKTILSENLGAAKAIIASYFHFQNEIVFLGNTSVPIPILEEIAPTSIKKYATDDGRAEKEELKFLFNLITELDINDDDIADAYWIAQTFLGTRTKREDYS